MYTGKKDGTNCHDYNDNNIDYIDHYDFFMHLSSISTEILLS